MVLPSVGADVDFLKQAPVEPDRALRLHLECTDLLELADCDLGVVPTKWQLQQFPAHLHRSLCNPRRHRFGEYGALERGAGHRQAMLPNDPEIEVLTYVSRGFEEYRGFPQAMQAIALLQKRRPNLHVLVVGSDVVAYGAGADGRSWGEWAKEDLSLDPARTLVGSTTDRRIPQRSACSDVTFT